MSNPDAIRTAIKAALDAALNPAGSDPTWNVSKYWRSNPDPPEIDMMLGPINYDTAMRAGNEDIRFVVRAVVQGGEDINYQALLDPLVDWSGSSSSLKAILEADRTLGGAVSAVRVADVSELKVFPSPGGGLPGVEFNVEVTPN